MSKNNYSTIFNSKLNFLVDTSYISQKMKSKSLPFADVPANRLSLRMSAYADNDNKIENAHVGICRQRHGKGYRTPKFWPKFKIIRGLFQKWIEKMLIFNSLVRLMNESIEIFKQQSSLKM